MPDTPLFPLGLVAFPQEAVNLHIFEPRYKQMINDCVSRDLPFGLIPYKDDIEMKYGTLMQVTEIARMYQDGRMDIRTIGLQVFQLSSFHIKKEDKLYPCGTIHVVQDDPSSNIVLVGRVLEKVDRLYEIMGIKSSNPAPTETFSVFEIGHKIGLSFDQEIELLTIPSEISRLEYVLNHLDHLIPVISAAEQMRHKVRMNGHFRNILPPQLGKT